MSLRAALAGVAACLAAALLSCDPSGAQAQATKPTPADTAENAPPTNGDASLPIPPVPPRIAEGADYEKCLGMLVADPPGADAMAASMAESGGGEGAAHCHALAQVELGNPEDGAALLDRLAAASHAQAAFRAVVFAQAGQAWTMAGRADQAYASATQAISLSPDDPDLLIGHAIAALSLRRFDEASRDLTHALELDPTRSDALILRATARRNLGQLAQARSDVETACAQDPEDPDGLLERGIIRQRQGDLAGARADWERAAELGADTATGDLAQQNLALLAAGPRQ